MECRLPTVQVTAGEAGTFADSQADTGDTEFARAVDRCIRHAMRLEVAATDFERLVHLMLEMRSEENTAGEPLADRVSTLISTVSRDLRAKGRFPNRSPGTVHTNLQGTE